ncbi:hypothetical protein [Leucobacter chromiireducens]|uniref:hypothetical protein n=1 Tax=Leucobacter chromiireducens TaxID=283877 RepID=UPI000F62F293|nr:hypothetical protein [Leucobacter chromiireducens]
MTAHDTLAGIAGLDAARAAALTGHRPAVGAAAEASLSALLDVADGDEAPGLDRATRLLSAARAAHVDRSRELLDYYLELLAEEDGAADGGADGAAVDVHALVTGGADGAAGRGASRQLRALLRHVDLLVLRPAAATPDDVDALVVAGWSIPEVVVLSQIVAFVTYQTRVAAGLAVLNEVPA